MTEPSWEYAEIGRLLAEVDRLTKETVTTSYHLYEITKLEIEIERLKAENAAQKAEMQKLYDNWVRVLNLSEEPKP